MKPASRELLASRGDTWGFLAEPYHLSDWWPGMLSVEPDRRGFAAGARWQVAVFADPLRLGPLRFPQVEQAGRAVRTADARDRGDRGRTNAGNGT